MTSSTPLGANAPLVNVGLAALAGGIALIAALRAAGSIAAWLSGHPQPAAPLTAGLGVLADPGDPAVPLGSPGLDPLLYWTVAATLVLGIGAAILWLVLRLRRGTTTTDVRGTKGVATSGEVARAASPRMLVKRAGTLRPGMVDGAVRPSDVGYLLGTSHGRQVWASVEDSMLLVGAPRSGKGVFIVLNAILDAPGAVVATSTRPDNLTVTLEARKRLGSVAVFDPQRLAPGLPVGMRWSPVRGCEDPLTAMIRATGLGSAAGFGDVESGGFWENKTRAAIQALLHAAAIDGRDARSLYQWALSPAAANDAVRILGSSSLAADGWADSLEGMINSDPRTRDSIWQGLGSSLQSLADPRVMEAVTPGEDEDFDPAAFIRERGTLHLLATAAGASASAPLVAAFIEDIVEVARRQAAKSPGARLDPPLLLALDEIGNLSPLPALPSLMAEGGGTGITTLAVLQSLAQAREKWGEHNASAIWDASILKVILGGGSNARDLQELSTLFGERDEPTDSLTYDHNGQRSMQRSIRRVPVLPPDAIRALPFGVGITVLRSARPIVTDLRPWTSRRDARQLLADRASVEAAIRAAH